RGPGAGPPGSRPGRLRGGLSLPRAVQQGLQGDHRPDADGVPGVPPGPGGHPGPLRVFLIPKTARDSQKPARQEASPGPSCVTGVPSGASDAGVREVMLMRAHFVGGSFALMALALVAAPVLADGLYLKLATEQAKVQSDQPVKVRLT